MEIKAFATLQRLATSSENAVRLRNAVDDLDVSDPVPRVTAPTLVIHARHNQTAPFDEGRRIAAGIANARFVTLESENHMPTPSGASSRASPNVAWWQRRRSPRRLGWARATGIQHSPCPRASHCLAGDLL